MNKKFVFLILCLLIITMIFTSCTSPTNDLMKGVMPRADDRISKPMDKNLNQAILNFTWNMFKESSSNPGNIMVSPTSAFFALAMTLNGADGDTKMKMQEALSSHGIATDALNVGLMDWMNNLMSDKRIAKLSVANSIWLRKGFEADEVFLQKNADYYSAAIHSLDFNEKSAVDIINRWVNNATNNTIDKIVEEIDDDVIMYLINAIYFKGDWKYQFSANNTYKKKFNAPSGIVETDFMNQRGNIACLKENDVTGVILPYLDEQFAFVGLLPKEGQSPRDLINSLTALDLNKLLDSSETKTVELSLPKFKSSYEDSLKDELSKLGMEIAFDPDRSDFSLMKKNHVKDIYISEIKQKTFIRVDEKGTEAAAVTSVEPSATSMPLEVPKIVFDRPFVYCIVDLTTGIPLFIGIMENPTGK